MERAPDPGEACNGGDCCECEHFILRRYDICSPENSTYYLDVYEDMEARRRRDSNSRI